MHLEYQEFLDYCEEWDLLNNQNRLKGKRKINPNIKEWTQSRNWLNELTNWVQGNPSAQVRMRYIIGDITQKNIKCPVCDRDRYWQDKNSRWSLTCGEKDAEHISYIGQIGIENSENTQIELYGCWAAQTKEFQEKQGKTMLQNHGVTCYAKTKEFKEFMTENKEEMNDKRKVTNKEKTGLEYPARAHYNQENFGLLTKEYMRKNFIDEEEHFLYQDFQKFINCGSASARNILKSFGIKAKHNKCGFNPELPGIVYYVKDVVTGYYKVGITNRDVKARFGSLSKDLIILKVWEFEVGQDAIDKEEFLLEEYSEFSVINERFSNGNGSTEFFSKDILNLDASES